MTHQHNDKLGNIKQTYEQDVFIKKVDQRKDNAYLQIQMSFLPGFCFEKSFITVCACSKVTSCSNTFSRAV